MQCSMCRVPDCNDLYNGDLGKTIECGQILGSKRISEPIWAAELMFRKDKAECLEEIVT